MFRSSSLACNRMQVIGGNVRPSCSLPTSLATASRGLSTSAPKRPRRIAEKSRIRNDLCHVEPYSGESKMAADSDSKIAWHRAQVRKHRQALKNIETAKFATGESANPAAVEQTRKIF